MAKFTPYAVSALPTTGIDINGIYFKKAAGDAKFYIYIRKNDNSDWVELGTVASVDTVNSLTGAVQLDLSFNTTTGVLSFTGSGVTVDLDSRYVKLTGAQTIAGVKTFSSSPAVPTPTGSTDATNKSYVDGLDGNAVHKTGDETVAGIKTFSNKPIVPTPSASGEAANKGYVDGLDAANVKLTGAQTIAGIKTFSSSPVVPAPTGSTDATNKTYVDTADNDLQSQIDDIASTVAEGIKTPTDLDCSTNPNYPASTRGDSYRVTVAGKIGGASGLVVEVGDLIVCKTTSAAGTQAAVGSNFYIVQGNLVQATETAAGTAKIATTAQTTSGTDDATMVTPLKLQAKLNTERTTSDGKYVRVDTAAQGLTGTQKSNARTNIGAADDSAVLHLTGNESVSGTKTFASSPVVPTPSAGDNSTKVASTAYADAAVTAGTAWGTKDW